MHTEQMCADQSEQTNARKTLKDKFTKEPPPPKPF